MLYRWINPLQGENNILLNLSIILANLLLTEWALVRLLPNVYLPVPVEAAGVGQHLAAIIARRSLNTGSKVTSLGNFVGIVVNLSDVLFHVVSRDKATINKNIDIACTHQYVWLSYVLKRER